MKSARFEVYQGVDRWWYWRLIAANGRQIAQGEGHTRERDAWRALQTVKRAVRPMVCRTSDMGYY